MKGFPYIVPEGFIYIVPVIIVIVVDEAVQLPECFKRFPNFFNNDSKAPKQEIE